ncbi:MFS transporter [Cupriavidus consociatus]|uniref:MFS transporter n=1 Tax=Cupriavidus consociatus TaxID=2821357 RepID=UPI001AE6334B|nr:MULTISPECIES: MFS transporter [unclassified Cupriavidus]MBP0625175.1 MFS transporter [Cupriavidus sp. LEh25]MDK2661915.1 MFS transporter [Cupriavidus sp. LEh21]
MLWKKSPSAVLATLLTIHLLAHIDRNMLLGFSPQIIKDLAINNAQYGFLVGAVWVLSFGGMAMIMGTLADRFSRTRIIAAGVLIWSGCTWASGHAQSFEQMAIARFFVASGEAALVPAAVSLLAELFPEKRRGTAMGLFFMGIPLGIGCSFLLAGTLGATHGWRDTFYILGMIGVAIAVPLAWLKEDRGQVAPQERGAPAMQQVRAVLQLIWGHRALRFTIVGFVLTHVAFASLSFMQLWLVNERGMDANGIATRIGALQLVFGTLGAVAGGVLSDRVAHRFRGGHASFIALLVVVSAPFVIACRLAPAGSALFYIGMCVAFFLPLAIYGPANAAIASMTPQNMRSTISGFTMLCINVFALATGTVVVGAATDYLIANGVTVPLTRVLLTTDALAISSALFFALAARVSCKQPAVNLPFLQTTK